MITELSIKPWYKNKPWTKLFRNGCIELFRHTVFPLLHQVSGIGGHYVTKRHDLVVDGPMGCGNTFLVRYIQYWNQQLVLSHHTHDPLNITMADDWRIPTIVILRDPYDAMRSTLCRYGGSVVDYLTRYFQFCKALEWRRCYIVDFATMKESVIPVVEDAGRYLGIPLAAHSCPVPKTRGTYYYHSDAVEKIDAALADMKLQTLLRQCYAQYSLRIRKYKKTFFSKGMIYFKGQGCAVEDINIMKPEKEGGWEDLRDQTRPSTEGSFTVARDLLQEEKENEI